MERGKNGEQEGSRDLCRGGCVDLLAAGPRFSVSRVFQGGVVFNVDFIRSTSIQ